MIDKRPVERRGAFLGVVDDADKRQSDAIAWMVACPSQSARASVI